MGLTWPSVVALWCCVASARSINRKRDDLLSQWPNYDAEDPLREDAIDAYVRNRTVDGPYITDAGSNGTTYSAVSNFTFGKGGFPPKAYLGNTLDMTAADPTSASEIAATVKTGGRLVNLAKDTEQKYLSSDIYWDVPGNCDFETNTGGATTDSKIYTSGEKAESEISAGGKLQGEFEVVDVGVAGDASIKRATHHIFLKNRQYSLFYYNAGMANVALQDWHAKINWEILEAAIVGVPKFTTDDQNSINAYRDLFGYLGTHIITATQFGSRISFMAYATNEDEEAKSNFELDIALKFNGFVDGMEIAPELRANITKSSQWKKFQGTVGKDVSCSGGDPALCAQLAVPSSDPGIHNVLERWINSTASNPAVTKFTTNDLWTLMAHSGKPALISFARDFRDAFLYIAAHPQQHITQVRMTLNVDFAAFALSTPAAILIPPSSGILQKGVKMTSTELTWVGVPGPELIIDFAIVNDGTPLCIQLQRGSAYNEPPKIEVILGDNIGHLTIDQPSKVPGAVFVQEFCDVKVDPNVNNSVVVTPDGEPAFPATSPLTNLTSSEDTFFENGTNFTTGGILPASTTANLTGLSSNVSSSPASQGQIVSVLPSELPISRVLSTGQITPTGQFATS